MIQCISSDLLERWLRAWSLSRKLPLPIKFKSGYKVDVGDDKQKARYVFTEPNEDYLQLTKTIMETWVFLKVCACAEDLMDVIPDHWVVQPQGYMMSCSSPMTIPKISLPDSYKADVEKYNATTVVRVLTKDGELASVGRLVIVDDLAVYDRISTEENHKRKGLATYLMAELEKVALSHNINTNFLVATEQGRKLYQALGWKVCSPYTTIVIPG